MKNTLLCLLACGLALLPSTMSAQSVPLTQDSYTLPGNPTNFGTATTINVGGPSGAQAMVQFDLSTLPAGTMAGNIAKATLALFVNKLGAAGTVNISVANGPWTESTVSGLNAPVPAAAVASGIAVPAANQYLYVDATAAVQSWLSGTANNGLILTPATGALNVAFDSKESATTSHTATLSIILTNTGPAGATGATGPTGPVSTVPGPAGATGPTGSTGTATPVAFAISVVFDNANKHGVSLGTHYDDFFAPIPSGTDSNTTFVTFPSSADVLSPRTCTLGQLYVSAAMTVTGNAADAGTITLMHGAGTSTPTPTALTCATPLIPNVVGSTASCSDTTDTVAVAAGDIIALRLRSEGGNGSPVVQFTVQMTCQ